MVDIRAVVMLAVTLDGSPILRRLAVEYSRRPSSWSHIDVILNDAFNGSFLNLCDERSR